MILEISMMNPQPPYSGGCGDWLIAYFFFFLNNC